MMFFFLFLVLLSSQLCTSQNVQTDVCGDLMLESTGTQFSPPKLIWNFDTDTFLWVSITTRIDSATQREINEIVAEDEQGMRMTLVSDEDDSGLKRNPSVAYGNGLYLILFESVPIGANFSMISGLSMDSNYQNLDLFNLGGMTAIQMRPQVIYNLDRVEFMALWQITFFSDLSTTGFARQIFRGDASLIGSSNVFRLSFNISSPVIAWNSDEQEYLMAFETGRPGNFDVGTMQLDIFGVPSFEASFISDFTGITGAANPSVNWGGLDSYIIAYETIFSSISTGLNVILVTTTQSPNPMFTNTNTILPFALLDKRDPQVTFTGIDRGRYLIAFHANRDDPNDPESRIVRVAVFSSADLSGIELINVTNTLALTEIESSPTIAYSDVRQRAFLIWLSTPEGSSNSSSIFSNEICVMLDEASGNSGSDSNALVIAGSIFLVIAVVCCCCCCGWAAYKGFAYFNINLDDDSKFGKMNEEELEDQMSREVEDFD